MVGGTSGREPDDARRIRGEIGRPASPPDLRLSLVPWRDSRRTRDLVHRLAREYGGNPQWRWWVLHHIVLPAGVAEYDDEGAARAIHAWWRDRIYFRPEPGEQVQTPGTTVCFGYGDCDDLTAGICSCLEAIGLRWTSELLGDPPFHIWPQVWLSGRWVHLEAAHSRAGFGEHPADLIRRLGRVGF